jgi:hypothetical protein
VDEALLPLAMLTTQLPDEESTHKTFAFHMLRQLKDRFA